MIRGLQTAPRSSISRARRIVVTATLVCGLTACSQTWPESPNVILISIDSLRADHLGIYGYERDTSPHLDRFARDAVVFETAYSTTSWTLPSHISMLTGLYPEVHGVQRGKQRLSEHAVLVSEIFQSMGYKTAAVVAGPYLRRRFGLDQGWDIYDDYTIRFRNSPASHQGVTAEREHHRIVELLDEFAGSAFFLFLHYWDVHYDYAPPPPWDRKFDPDYSGKLTGNGYWENDQVHPDMDPRDLDWIRALYDGEIAFTDHYLGKLFDELDRRGLYEDSLIVFVSDHGDEFFEHGSKGHRAALYEETLRVPLIVRFPGGRWAGSRSSRPASVVDIAPTLLDVADSDRSRKFNGSSLAIRPGGRDDSTRRALFADLHGRQKAIVSDGWKLVVDLESPDAPDQLYDLRRDPGEKSSLVDEEPSRAAELRRVIDQWLASAERQQANLGQETVELDEETRRIMESLGYVD